MFRTRSMILVLMATLLVFSFCGVTQAGVSGKISGAVADKKTGEALPSVAVQIVGTTQGALTDPDGHYMIMNVSPGIYSVKFTLIGYKTIQVDGVQVTADRSADVTVQLEPTSVESDIIQKVQAKKDIMEMSKPTSNVTIASEQIEMQPVANVEDLLETQVGVVKRNGELHIRGGRAGEVSYVVDGVETKDPLGGLGPTQAGMNLSSNTIEEIQIIKGGYDPEYGRAMSGIVSINTKAGTQTTEGEIELYTDNFRAPNMNKYSNNYDRIYFSLGGPEPFFAGRIMPALGIDYFKDKLFYFFSVDTYKTDGNYEYRKYTPPDRQRDWLRRNVLGYNLRDRQQNYFSLTSKLTYKITNNIKMVLNYQGIWQDETVFHWKYRYTPATAPIGNDVNQRLSATFTHQINKSTFYEFLVSRVYHEYSQRPDDPKHPGYGMTPDEFLFEDQYEDYDDKNGNGVYDEPEPFINIYYDTSFTYGGPQYNFGDVFVYVDEEEPYHLYDPWGLGGETYRFDPEMLEADYVLNGLVDTILWDWNGDGRIGYSDAEPFVDLNNNGRWDRGDKVKNDQNGNNRFDIEYRKALLDNVAEPFTDGDINLGEPFTDLNGNGVYDEGIDSWMGSSDPTRNQDLNNNGIYDGPDDPWTPGIPFIDLNGNGIYDEKNRNYDEGEPFVDLNGNKKWDPPTPFLYGGYHDGILGPGDEDPHFHESSSETWTFDFKLTKQLVREHELKTGFQVLLRDFNYSEISNPWVRREGAEALPDGGPFPDRGARRDFYHHNPVEGAYFLQDIIEYGSLVARLGFRYDFFFQSNAVDTLVPHFQQFGKGSVIKSRGKISPRLGISYPISERAKIYFNYGHFYQLPPYTRMYRRLGQDRGTIGNPNLDYEKTVQYEFGVRYNLSGDYVLDIAGFYKDIFGTVNGQKLYYPDGRESSLSDFENSDYGRARGFEIQLEKRYGNFVSGSVNYTYSFAYGKASSDISNFEDLAANRKTPIKEFPLNWDIRHQLNVNFGLRISRADHPKLFGYSIPNDWGLTFNWQLNSGLPFTPDKTYPNMEQSGGGVPLTNSLRKPSYSNVNLRFSKSFSLSGIDYSFQLWIDNLFDKKNVETVHSATGRPDTGTNLPEGVVLGGTDYDKVPWYVSPGRNIKVGLTLSF